MWHGHPPRMRGRHMNFGKSTCCDMAIGLLCGGAFGFLLNWQADALQDFLVNGPHVVLLEPCVFTAGAGVLLGWVLVAVAEGMSRATGPWTWVPVSLGLLAFALGAVLVSEIWAPPGQGRLLGGSIAIVVAPGLIAAWVRIGSSSQ